MNITIERAVLEQALAALVRSEVMHGQPNFDIQDKLREALAQPQPVQEQCPECDGTGTVAGSQAHFPCPICTSPQAQPLSDEQKQEIHNETGAGHALISLVESYITKGTT